MSGKRKSLQELQAANAPQPDTDRYRFGGSFAFSGITDRTIRWIEEVQLLDEGLWRRFVEQFRTGADTEDAGWRGEYWGKMMRGACFVYDYTRNERLYQVLTATVCDMLESADSQGRISTYGKEKEYTGWDLWDRKYVLLGMQYFLEICRQEELAERVVESMRRQADCILHRIGPKEEGKLPITKATNHWRGLNSSSLLEPIVRLYRLTGEERYLDFADYIVGAGGTSVADVFALACEDQLLPCQYPMTKAYEMISCFEGLLEYWRVRRRPEHRQAVVQFAGRVLESDFTVIGSSGCTHELFDHSTVRQANEAGGQLMQETCVTVTLMKFFWQLARLTGDGKYVDAFERSYYNAYLGAVNTHGAISPQLARELPQAVTEPFPFDSYSPLTAGLRGQGIGGLKLMADGHVYGCCACIGAAGAGLVPKMALMASDDGIAVNLYLPGVLEAALQNRTNVRIGIETAYPRDGSIRLRVETEEAEPFALRLRIPGWSHRTRTFVNGAPAAAKRLEEGYLILRQSWKGDNEILLELDMRTEAVRPIPYGHEILMNRVVWEEQYVVPAYDEEDPKAKQRVSLRRGPLALAADSELGYDAAGVFDLAVEEDGYVKARFPGQETVSYDHMVELEIPLRDGGSFRMTDYASAGKRWQEGGRIAAWIEA